MYDHDSFWYDQAGVVKGKDGDGGDKDEDRCDQDGEDWTKAVSFVVLVDRMLSDALEASFVVLAVRLLSVQENPCYIDSGSCDYQATRV